MSTIIIAIILFGLAFLGFRHYLKGKGSCGDCGVFLSHQRRDASIASALVKNGCVPEIRKQNHWSIEPMVLFTHYSWNRIHIQLMRWLCISCTLLKSRYPNSKWSLISNTLVFLESFIFV